MNNVARAYTGAFALVAGVITGVQFPGINPLQILSLGITFYVACRLWDYFQDLRRGTKDATRDEA